MKNWFNNLRISRKLTVGFLVVTVLGIIVGVVGITNLTTLSRNQQATYNQCTKGILISEEAMNNFIDIRVAIRDIYINYGFDKTKYYDQIAADLKAVEDLLNQYSQTVSGNQAQANYDTMKTAYFAYEDNVNKMVATPKKGDSSMIYLQLMLDSEDSATKALNGFKTVAEYNSKLASDRLITDMAATRTATYILIGVLIIAIILAFLISSVISKDISNPMQKFADFAKLLAVGDIDVKKVIDAKDELLKFRKDEVGALADSFNKMIASTIEQSETVRKIADGDLTTAVKVHSESDVLGKALAELVGKFHNLTASIILAADQVASGASLVSNSSMVLSQGAAEQASSVQQLTASLEEIASQTTENAKNAERASEFATEAKRNAETGNSHMADMLRAMDDINISSGSINKIIKVIDDIAFQTNILALNAAVEAARAGQAGKGFAVVAEEVRTLAAKSAQAAKETTDLIDSSIRKVETGTKIANETAVALAKIVAEVTKATELIGQIASASNEQAAAIEQVNQGVIQVSQVVQSNVATSEESAAASEELSSQAAGLKVSISVFKVKGSVNKSMPSSSSFNSKGQTTDIKALPDSSALKVRKTALSLCDNNFGKY